MLASWEEVGLARDDFWCSTPSQIRATMRARGLIMIREHNERAWVAWQVARLTRVKQFPKLQTLQAKKPSRIQPWQEQIHIMDQWVRATRHYPPSKKSVN